MNGPDRCHLRKPLRAESGQRLFDELMRRFDVLPQCLSRKGRFFWTKAPFRIYSNPVPRARDVCCMSQIVSLHLTQGVTFDVGGTLIEPWPSVGHVYNEVAVRHGFKNITPEILNRQFAAAWSAQKDFNHTRSEWAALVEATFEGLTRTPPGSDFFTELYARFAEQEAWRVFDDVVPTLDALASRGMKLGVISNWDERLRPLLRALKLHDYFDSIVVSHEVGFPKPSSVIFQHASEKMGLPPESLLHVGDSFGMDVDGARAAGFEALEIRRRRENGQSPGITSLLELISLLPEPTYR